jgi:membrane fusion protein, multidrug efflux system
VRVLSRALLGLLLITLTIAPLGYGVYSLLDAQKNASSRPKQVAEERIHIANVATLEAITAQPVMQAYGEVRSWRTLEIRAPAAGRLVEVAANFRDGAEVAKAASLAIIDPADPTARRLDAQAGVAEATAELGEAREAAQVATQELNAAERQRTLRTQSLGRQKQLRQKGFATAAEIESAELALANADQSVRNRAQMAIGARNRIERATLGLQRAHVALADAERGVGDTRLSAPFAGLLTNVQVVLGRLVSVNEKLAELIDPTALEVAFRVSNRQFANLLDARGQIMKLALTVALDLGERTIEVTGRIQRADAVVGQGQSGRLMFARLETTPGSVLRPGDFVAVYIQEQPLEKVAKLPATAVTEDGRILYVTENKRLAEQQATIVRRHGNTVLVRDVPFGREVVLERLPQFADGVRIRPVKIAAPATPSETTSSTQTASAPIDDGKIQLEPTRRDFLIAAIKKAERIPEERRAWLIGLLEQQRVPKRLVDRIEARIAEAQGS